MWCGSGVVLLHYEGYSLPLMRVLYVQMRWIICEKYVVYAKMAHREVT